MRACLQLFHTPTRNVEVVWATETVEYMFRSALAKHVHMQERDENS